jgi:hypothetical protein
MTGGTALSARAREGESARVPGSRVLLGQASAGAGDYARMGRAGGEGGVGPSCSFVFLFQKYE